MKTLTAILKATCLLAATAATPAIAGPFDDLAKIDIIPGWQTPSGTHMAGLRVTLRPGWKTYWRAPGDAGIPPQFSWTGSQNITAAQFHWPVPEVFDQGALQSIGYHDTLVLPIELTQIDPDAPIQMSGEITIGVCEDICVPVSLPFTALLPTGGRRDGAITASLLNQPITASDAGVQSATCQVSAGDQGLVVTATLAMPTTGQYESVVIEAGNPEVWVSQADITRNGDILLATVDMIHASASSFALDRSAIRITVLGSDYAVDVRGCAKG
jgi:DsbC/DsbD-like thiol-disulfide interchange protein